MTTATAREYQRTSPEDQRDFDKWIFKCHSQFDLRNRSAGNGFGGNRRPISKR